MSIDVSQVNTDRLAATLAYNPYWRECQELIDGYTEATPVVKVIIRDFVNQKKIIGSYSIAVALITKQHFKEGVVVTEADVQTAYDIGAGGGCEYEWPEE